MKVGLFIPCYVDQFFPEVGRATVEILEAQQIEVDFPQRQTCCGQPAWNAGLRDEARELASNFERIFADYEYVVAPSASCVAMVRKHYLDQDGAGKGAESCRNRVLELCEFLWTTLGLRKLPGAFPHRVGLHQGCHGLRDLKLGPSTELVHESTPDPTAGLLQSIKGLELVPLSRPDECCGFGGTFAWSESAVSVRMGEDRLADHERAGAEILASTDSSCLAHLSGIWRRRGEHRPVMHVAEILAGHAPQWP